MAIDWSQFNPNFGQQFGAIFDPAAIQEKQNKLSLLANQDALQRMQLAQAAEQLRRAPIEYQQKQDEINRQKALRDMIMNASTEQLNDPQWKQKMFLQVAPEQAVAQMAKPEKTVPETNLGKLRIERDAIAARNPNDPFLRIYDNAIRKESDINNQPQPITPVTIQDPDNPNATIVVDGRTGKKIGAGPKLTQTGMENFKQAKSMQGLSKDLQLAEDLLMGQKRDSEGNVTQGNLPTGSAIGSLYDTLAGAVGVTPAGAQEADSLKVVAARLVGKVPRFEGPQSDKDVALYKQAAGDAGNEKLPRERRLAAIQTMRQIYSGYEDGTRGQIVQDMINSGSQKPAQKQSGGWGITRVK